MALTRYKRYMPTLMLGALCLMYAAFLSDRATVERLTREDGPIETCGALLLLAASVLFFIAYLGSNHPNRKHDGPGERSRRNLFFLLLSAMFVLGFLEEISWGQRILNNKTPDFILTENTQGETNIHNLR